MKTRQTMLLALVFSSLLAWPQETAADRYGAPHPQAPPEIGQWLFMRGEWDVTLSAIGPDGSETVFPDKSRVKCYYLADGLTVQDEFIVKDRFFSTHIRAYHHEQKQWINKFINSKRQRWTTTTSTWQDGKMTTLVPGGYSGKEDYLVRGIYSEITDNRFVSRIANSNDEGKTWKQTYVLVYERVGTTPKP